MPKGPAALTRDTKPKDCNPLCGKCRRHCRQPAAAVLVDCPRFLPFPFKVAKHRFDQLELFSDQG